MLTGRSRYCCVGEASQEPKAEKFVASPACVGAKLTISADGDCLVGVQRSANTLPLQRDRAPRSRSPIAHSLDLSSVLEAVGMLGDQRPASSRHLFVARLQLYALRLAREQPRVVALFVMLLVSVLLLIFSRRPCEECQCHTASSMAAPTTWRLRTATQPELTALRPLPLVAEDTGASTTTMAHVVVGVMTANRFHRTRCSAQSATWLRRARRVVFFSDSVHDAASEHLMAPLVVHRFQPSPTEHIFVGGNWRAVPILRALAEGFFSTRAQAAMRSRAEPLPRWTFMVDDDAFVFVPQMLEKISALDADDPHYLGYAFIAAPHLEGIIPGKRQPLFANGGAGIAVSRGALSAALPIFAKCEDTYKWNWPGDVRVAQCLLDAGVSLTWVHSFHAEAPGVIIHKQRPPPGSVPVGLHLPPISFHHVDPDTVFALHRMQTATMTIDEQPHEVDFSMHAFQPLSATHPTSGVRLQMHFGFEVILCPAVGCNGRANLPSRSATRNALDNAASGLGTILQAGNFLAAFDRVSSVEGVGSGAVYRQTFTGDECWQEGRLIGGLSAVVTTHCGACDSGSSGSWNAQSSPSGLAVCRFSLEQCTLYVSVSLQHCPQPTPLRRVGLDVGSAPNLADAIRDGVATARWTARRECDEGDTPCASIDAAMSANLTLWCRVLSGNAILRIMEPEVSRPGLQVVASTSMLMLSGAVPTTTSSLDEGDGFFRQLEPPSVPLVFYHTCATAGRVDVRVQIQVSEAVPIEVGWQIIC